jgi:hypothetical protein
MPAAGKRNNVKCSSVFGLHIKQVRKQKCIVVSYVLKVCNGKLINFCVTLDANTKLLITGAIQISVSARRDTRISEFSFLD